MIRRLSILAVGLMVILSLVSACTMHMPRKVSHAGFSVVVPHDWGDYTHEAPDCLTVARIWGSVSFGIAKAPGESVESLALFRDVWVNKSPNGTEEKITEWYGFKGHGFRFLIRARDGEVIREGVLFFPDGELSGWYLRAVVTNSESGARKGFEKVLRSLRWEALGV